MRDSVAEMIHEMLPGAAMCCSCRDYSITACNRFFREILGYASEDEGLYESGILLAHIFPRDLGTFMQYLSDLQQAEDVPPCTVRFRRRDEAHRWISLHGRRIGSALPPSSGRWESISIRRRWNTG